MASALSQILSSTVTERLPLILAAVLALASTIIVPVLLKNDPLSRIPFIGTELGGSSKRRASYLTGAKHLYSDGYKRFKNGVCRMTTARKSEVIIVAPAFLPELKKLPDDVLSMSAATGETLESKYTKIETDNPMVAHTIKSTLTPNLVRLNPILAEEVERTVSAEMPPCKGWTKVNINSKLLRIVAIISGRIFVGPELCHDEAYIDAAINYTVELVDAMNAIKEIPPWKKSFKAPFLPQVKKIEQRTEEALRLIKPIVAARRAGASAGDPAWRKPDDMLQWMTDSTDDDVKLTNGQLILTFAAIHTTTLTSTNAFYNLATQPELVAELREEIRSVLKQHDGKFTSAALQGMKKMDSVLKETLRLHPPSFASFERKVLKPFTLSNGQLIPAGVTIEAPAYGPTRDPSVFSEPDKFDGLRFYRLRDQAETFNKPSGASGSSGGTGRSASVEAAAHNQFVSVSQNSLTFGYGRHACPGRFFAANEIKMIMARMILQYDFSNVDGSTERYPNFEISNTSIPDTSRELLFREVAAEA